MSTTKLNGFVLVDKPGGWTSHDVVAKMRGLAGLRKVGHAGTLDPMATGLLVLGLGRSTRLLRFVQLAPKRYVATAKLGVATDSLDADGAVVWREPMPVDESEVAGVLDRFRGPILQVPPMVSARKVEGTRLYELARKGSEVEREARAVTITHLEIVDFAPCDYPEITFEVTCSTGTYVRTLADDIARALGGRAHLIELRRLTNGSLDVADAFEIEALETLADEGRLGDAVLTPAAGLPDLASVVVDAQTAAAVGNGVALGPGSLQAGLPPDGPIRVLDGDGRLLAVYRVEAGRARPEVVFS
jgi:tRNA pseudouridine55 synthase